MVGYTKVTATDTEIAAFLAKKGYRPTVDRVSCDGCGKRIWGSGIGIGAHNRSKACRAEQQRQAAQAANLSENTTCTLTNECPVCAGGSICADRCATCNGTNSRMCKTHDSILLAVPPAEIIRADEITVDVAADIDAVNAEHDALMDGYVTGQPATEILTPVTFADVAESNGWLSTDVDAITAVADGPVNEGFWSCCQARPAMAVAFTSEETGERVWYAACRGCASTVRADRLARIPASLSA